MLKLKLIADQNKGNDSIGSKQDPESHTVTLKTIMMQSKNTECAKNNKIFKLIRKNKQANTEKTRCWIIWQKNLKQL